MSRIICSGLWYAFCVFFKKDRTERNDRKPIQMKNRVRSKLSYVGPTRISGHCFEIKEALLWIGL